MRSLPEILEMYNDKIKRYEDVELVAPNFCMVNTADLKVDGYYQRPLDVDWVCEIAENWDFRLVRVLKVGKRPDGSEVILDGHHTNEAAISLGITQLMAEVIYVPTVEVEAELFYLLNDSSKRLSPSDKFQSALACNREPEISIAALLQTTGHVVGAAKYAASPSKSVNCATTLKRLARSDMLALNIVWPLAVKLCANLKKFEADVLEALHVTEIQLADGCSLSSPLWQKRLTTDYTKDILEAYRGVKNKSQELRATEVLEVLNKRMSANKLVLKS